MKIACLFGGYGSQFVGMGKSIYDESRVMQEYFEQASHCLETNFVKLCFASSDVQLSDMEKAYTSLFLVNSSIFAVLRSHKISVDMVCGYNDGEYSALCASGSILFADGLYLLHKYCQIYQEARKNFTFQLTRVVGVDTQKIQHACMKASMHESSVEICMYDGLYDHVIIGDEKGTDRFWNVFVSEKDVSLDNVPIESGLHSSYADAIIAQFKMYLEKVDFNNARIPVCSNVTGELVTQGKELQSLFLRHMTSPLLFVRVLEKLSEYDVIVLPFKMNRLVKQLKLLYPKKQVVVIRDMKDVERLQNICS